MIVLNPKSKDDIIKNLSILTQVELNVKLFEAAWNGQTSVVKILLEAGADVNARNVVDSTPLMFASHKGHKNHIDIIKMLLDAGADVNIKNEYGNNVLNFAGGKGEDIIKLLKQYGAKY